MHTHTHAHTHVDSDSGDDAPDIDDIFVAATVTTKKRHSSVVSEPECSSGRKKQRRDAVDSSDSSDTDDDVEFVGKAGASAKPNPASANLKPESTSAKPEPASAKPIGKPASAKPEPASVKPEPASHGRAVSVKPEVRSPAKEMKNILILRCADNLGGLKIKPVLLPKVSTLEDLKSLLSDTFVLVIGATDQDVVMMGRLIGFEEEEEVVTLERNLLGVGFSLDKGV
jgi:hypothetical protein